MYKWLWFDLDNTLLDFTKSSKLAFNLLLENHGVESSTKIKNIYNRINSWAWEQYELGKLTVKQIKTIRFEKFFKEIGIEVDGYAVNDEYLIHVGQNPFFVEHAKSVLEYAIDKEYNLAIVTNGMSLAQAPRLEKLGIKDNFQHIFVSEEIGFSKPSLAYFNHCKEQSGLTNKDEVLVIGDTLSSDILGANKFGVDACWYNPQGKVDKNNLRIKYEIQSMESLMDII